VEEEEEDSSLQKQLRKEEGSVVVVHHWVQQRLLRQIVFCVPFLFCFLSYDIREWNKMDSFDLARARVCCGDGVLLAPEINFSTAVFQA